MCRAVVSMQSCGKHAKQYESTGASKRHLWSCKRNLSQCAKLVNSTSKVVDTPEPTVYILPIVPHHTNLVWLKHCTYWLLLCSIVMLPLQLIVEISYNITLQCIYHLTPRHHYLEKQESICIILLLRLNWDDREQLGEYKLRVLGYRWL